MSGVLFCDGQSVFSSLENFAGVCALLATLIEYFPMSRKGRNKRDLYGLVVAYLASKKPSDGATT